MLKCFGRVLTNKRGENIYRRGFHIALLQLGKLKTLWRLIRVSETNRLNLQIVE